MENKTFAKHLQKCFSVLFLKINSLKITLLQMFQHVEHMLKIGGGSCKMKHLQNICKNVLEVVNLK